MQHENGIIRILPKACILAMPPSIKSSDGQRPVDVSAGGKRKRPDEGIGLKKKRQSKGPDMDEAALAGSVASNGEGEEEIAKEDLLEPGLGEDDESDQEEDIDEDDGESEDIDESEEEDNEDESDEYSEFEEFKWLKSIDVNIKAENSVDDRLIGHCHAKLIDREPIRATFYRDMEEPTNDTSELAFHLFDRWGCLKSEFRDHPVKKGTGVWGVELDKSKFLFIEDLKVNENNRRNGYGRKLVEQVWEKAQSMVSDCDFAIVFATYTNPGIMDEKTESLPPGDRELLYDGLQTSAEDFWRAVGFRRIGSSLYFARAKDPSHASRSLSAAQDYRRPVVLRFPSSEGNPNFPCDQTIIQSNDGETLELLKARLLAHPATDPVWLSVDKHGNNIMHAVARGCKAESLSWLLQLPISEELRSSRNLRGETPLEGLEDLLESKRTMGQVGLLTIPMADSFGGFAPLETNCLLLLKGLSNPTPDQIMQLAYGCTCGECLGGFLSPRLSFALECRADANRDMLGDMLDGGMMPMSGSQWCDWNDYHFSHLGPGIKSNLKTNKALRQGFNNIFGYVAEAIRAKKVPTAFNVLHYADGEWPPCTKNFLQRGGTVAAVVLACFDGAMSQDEYLGDGEHQLDFQETDIDKFPTCRNDGEFVFASQHYRAMEGLPANGHPEMGMRGMW